ncbi:MAG: hypothetical protein V4574_18830 [Pseudomonadota bacterium]
MDLAIVIAESPNALRGVAQASGLDLLEDTIREFDSLTTEKQRPQYNAAGHIETGLPGFVAFARVL